MELLAPEAAILALFFRPFGAGKAQTSSNCYRDHWLFTHVHRKHSPGFTSSSECQVTIDDPHMLLQKLEKSFCGGHAAILRKQSKAISKGGRLNASIIQHPPISTTLKTCSSRRETQTLSMRCHVFIRPLAASRRSCLQPAVTYKKFH